MINLIKSDLYRLFKSKTYKNCLIASIGIATFILILSIFTDVSLWLMAFTGSDGLRRGFNIWLENGVIFNQLIINALASGAGIYIIGITLTSSVISSQRRSGIMKSTAAYGYERWKIYLSQLVTLIIGMTVVISVSFILILTITAIVFRPEDIDYESILLAIKALILYIIIIGATMSIYMFISTLITNSEVVSVIAIAEIMGLTMLTPALPSTISNWIPYSMIRTLAQIPQNIDFTLHLFNCIVIIAISTVLGVILFNRREIK